MYYLPSIWATILKSTVAKDIKHKFKTRMDIEFLCNWLIGIILRNFCHYLINQAHERNCLFQAVGINPCHQHLYICHSKLSGEKKRFAAWFSNHSYIPGARNVQNSSNRITSKCSRVGILDNACGIFLLFCRYTSSALN